ncbi:hypothetical protein Fmac_025094 [Flemingia macrophylla]|uniref:H15 domain-containing protein n=1 Tax=Flemingia macrophylla TaxID=520843 RepID=A0ABD1LR91_9FABA
MIMRAIKELNEESGSTEEAISKFIGRDQYEDLPFAHLMVFNVHLRKLCLDGVLVCRESGSYVLIVDRDNVKDKPNQRRKRNVGSSTCHNRESGRYVLVVDRDNVKDNPNQRRKRNARSYASDNRVGKVNEEDHKLKLVMEKLKNSMLFRLKALNLSASINSAHASYIGDSLQHLFKSIHTPTHPRYAQNVSDAPKFLIDYNVVDTFLTNGIMFVYVETSFGRVSIQCRNHSLH